MHGNWIEQVTTSTGTGDVTMTAVSGLPGFASQFAVGETFKYTILDSNRKPVERGFGHLNVSGDLVRDKVRGAMVAGEYDETALTATNLASGEKIVICALDAQSVMTPTPGVWGPTHKGYGDTGTQGAASTVLLVADRAYAIPFAAGVDAEVDAFLFRVTTAAVAGKVAKVAIFSVGSDGLPGVMLAESSPVAVDSIGVKPAVFAAPIVPPARFFACLLSDGAPSVQGFGTIIGTHAMGFDSSLIGVSYIHHVGASSLVFPSTWTPVANLSSATRPQLVARCV